MSPAEVEAACEAVEALAERHKRDSACGARPVPCIMCARIHERAARALALVAHVRAEGERLDKARHEARLEDALHDHFDEVVA